MIRHTYHYTGRVQGVGFRWTVCELAGAFCVAGTVENLPDGRVRLVAEGEAEQLENLNQAINQRMSRNITEVGLDVSPATGQFGEPTFGGVCVSR